MSGDYIFSVDVLGGVILLDAETFEVLRYIMPREVSDADKILLLRYRDSKQCDALVKLAHEVLADGR